jgi:hypothetical protein
MRTISTVVGHIYILEKWPHGPLNPKRRFIYASYYTRKRFQRIHRYGKASLARLHVSADLCCASPPPQMSGPIIGPTVSTVGIMANILREQPLMSDDNSELARTCLLSKMRRVKPYGRCFGQVIHSAFPFPQIILPPFIRWEYKFIVRPPLHGHGCLREEELQFRELSELSTRVHKVAVQHHLQLPYARI